MMTRTIQPYSWALLSETKKNLNTKKIETEDNMSLLLSIFDSLNNLNEKLSRLNYLLQRKKMELILLQKNKFNNN